MPLLSHPHTDVAPTELAAILLANCYKDFAPNGAVLLHEIFLRSLASGTRPHSLTSSTALWLIVHKSDSD